MSAPKTADAASEKTGPDYKHTLFLPKTDFPMRAGLPKREPDWLAKWEKMGLYQRQREESRNRTPFILHDGPPYANGHLHIGHALNKILKDMVVRSQQVMGKDSRFAPGWDCHGLPIEWKIEEQYRAKGADKDAVPVNEFRAECRKFAEGWIDVQREEFKRLGVTGDWQDPYTTMAYSAEAKIAEEFIKFVMNGTLYQGSKPVMWSVVEKTALAEAEVEYHEHQSHTIWVKFPVVKAYDVKGGARPDLLGVNVVIWTTTPWTIPQNRAVAFNPALSYGLYEVTEAAEDNWAKTGDRYLLSDELAAEVFAAARVDGYQRVRDVPGDQLDMLVCAHPWRGAEGADGEWDYDVPMLPGDHVTDEAGTGFVHTAPSHGADDYVVGVKHGLPMTHNVGEDGSFRADLPFFGGLEIFTRKGKEGKANKACIDKLAEAGALIARGRVKHSYPHSWRSKAPLIFRNTPQWFIAIDKPMASDDERTKGKTIRELALASIDRDVRWVPQSGRNRLYSMIEARPDWVVSRQRAWGVPLTCFMRQTGPGEVELLRNEDVNARIVQAFRDEGADAWFAEGARERFLSGIDGVNPDEWEKVTDILDVWFDSGCTHSFVMEDREDGAWPSSLYLEGTDQHRGWFHSSLLEACGTRGRAPYEAVLTHGFTLDEKGMKMSKSVGNSVVPETVVKQYGADILRLWVASTDYTEDQRIGPEILKSNADAYRRLRNTLRFILGALDGWDEAERLPVEEMPELERYVLNRIRELDVEVREGYEAFEFQKVFSRLFNFCTVNLSSIYFDIRKDSLYCDAPTSISRRAARTVLDILFHRLTAWLSPILVFTMEEVWLERFPGDDSSVHLQVFPEAEESWRDEALKAKWDRIRAARAVVTGALEIQRREKTIGASLEAAPTLYIADPDTFAAVKSVDMAEICITSGIEVVGHEPPAEAFRLEDPAIGVVFEKADGAKCARCWKILPDVGAHAHEAVCGRCDGALG